MLLNCDKYVETDLGTCVNAENVARKRVKCSRVDVLSLSAVGVYKRLYKELTLIVHCAQLAVALTRTAQIPFVSSAACHLSRDLLWSAPAALSLFPVLQPATRKTSRK